MTLLTRRKALLSVLAMPAIIRTPGVLMPIKPYADDRRLTITLCNDIGNVALLLQNCWDQFKVSPDRVYMNGFSLIGIGGWSTGP